MPRASFAEKLRQDRSQLRDQVTPAERVLVYSLLVLGFVLPVAGGVLIASGSSTRGVGVAVLVLALLLMAVVSPAFSARLRRRQRERGKGPS